MKKFRNIFLLFFVSVGIFSFWVWWQIPSTKTIKGCFKTKMFEVNLCPGSKDYVPFSQISKLLVHSVISSEDANFWNHNGFDFDEIENSFWQNLKAGRFARGGSTITQQLAKNLFLSKEKTLSRKFIEVLITIKLEKVLSKREILERYLNVVEFGKGVYGVKKASATYFQKSPAGLSILESAFLTMLLPSPVKYSKSFHQKNLTPYARKRMQVLFNRLYKSGHISASQRDESYLMLDWFLKGKDPTLVEVSPKSDGDDDNGGSEYGNNRHVGRAADESETKSGNTVSSPSDQSQIVSGDQLDPQQSNENTDASKDQLDFEE